MLRGLRNWLRIVLPADYAVGVVLVLVALVYGVAAIRAHMGDVGAWESAESRMRFLVFASTILYAGFRVIYFHPVENRPYGTWLVNSPWRHPQPLPLGPLHLVSQDIVVILALMVLFPAEVMVRLWVPTLFLLVYCVSLAYCHCRLGIYWPAYGVAFLFGCFVLAIQLAWARLAVAAAMYPIVYFGLQELLRRFPFTEADRKRLRLSAGSDAAAERLVTLGWPVPPVLNERWSWSITHVNAVLLASTTAWLFFCVSFHFRELSEYQDAGLRGLGMIAVSAVIARILIYMIGYIPPISVLGRFATRRLILPGYDVVFIAPLAVLIAAGLLPDISAGVGLPPIISISIAAGVAVWLALALPPRRVDWQYVGHHRIAYRFRAMLLDRSNSSKERK